jgi:ABC-2 type transport system ATP-binding protein
MYLNQVSGKSDRTPVIEVRKICKSFKTVKAVQGVSFSVEEGEFIALLGPNGAGKTTLVEMIEGIQKPDAGDILITGKSWKGHEVELRRIMGLSLQETYFIDKLTSFETLSLFASFYRLGRERAQEVLHLVGLQEKRKSYVVNLSGGQRQRLALGIALLNKPRILILDEPTTGLDPNARREVWAILEDLRKTAGTSLLLTTHYMEEAEKLCNYIIIMDGGKVLREGTINRLLEEDKETKSVEFALEGKHDRLETAGSPFTVSWDPMNQKGSVSLLNLEKDLPAFISMLAQKDLHIRNLTCRKRTLDDLFTNLTGRHLDE